MKKFIALIIISILAFTYLLWPHGRPVPKEVILVNKILHQSAQDIEIKYKLEPIGSGASMPGGPLIKLNLAFSTESAFIKDELRALIIASTNEVVQLVNANPDILEILLEPPFTFKNVDITIYNHDANGNKLYDPEIGVARISNGILGFSIRDRLSDAGYKSTVEETYEEALKLMETLNK